MAIITIGLVVLHHDGLAAQLIVAVGHPRAAQGVGDQVQLVPEELVGGPDDGAASPAPALAVGLKAGTIQAGRAADLLVLDSDLALKAAIDQVAEN